MIIIPAHTLSEDALYGLIHEFVTRDGTDYGAIEHSVDSKIAQVKRQLSKGDAVIVFDEDEQSVHIVGADSIPKQHQ